MEDTMKKVIILCMLLALSFSTYSCGGGGAGSSSSPDGENPKTPSIVKLMPSHYVAQTNSFISLHTKVLDGNGAAVKDVPVTFTNLSDPFGKISIKSFLSLLGLYKQTGVLSTTTVKTNSLGIATVKLSSTTPGFATVQAEVNTGAGIVRDKKTVYFTFSLVTTTPPPTLKLHVDDGDGTYDEKPADFELFKTPPGDNERTIKAVLLDGFGRPLQGKSVLFGSDSPNEVQILTNNPPLTNDKGEASVLIRVNPSIVTSFSRVLNITAAADSDGNGSYETPAMLTLFLDKVEVDTIAVSARPSIVTTNGTSTIVAVVTLKTGTPTPDGTSVNFSATCGNDPFVIPPFASTTNANGTAQVIFTAPSTPGTCEVAAIAGGVEGKTTINVVTSTLVVIPATQTISDPKIDDFVTYEIKGGVGPYTVVASNPGLVKIDLTLTGFKATVINVPSSDTPVTFTIHDSRNVTATATLILDVGPPVALSVNPINIALTGFTNPDSDTADDATFYIQGGKPPYSMYSDNDAIILSKGLLLTGNTFQIDPEAVETDAVETVLLTIEDSLGATITANVTVNPPESFMSTNPKSIKVIHPATVLFSILGGLPKYRIYPDTLGVADIGIADPAVDNHLEVDNPSFTAKTVGAGTVNFQIVDKDGKTATASMTVVTQAAEPIKVLPSAQTVNGAPGGTATFKIFGGLPPYEIFTSNPLFQPDPNPVPAIGDTFSVTVPPNTPTTSVTYTIRDSVGNSGGPVTLTITSTATDFYALPEAATFSVGGSMTFTIFGGNEPFDFFVDNNELVWILYDASIDPRSFTVIGLASGSVTVTIRDEDGRQKTVDVTIQ